MTLAKRRDDVCRGILLRVLLTREALEIEISELHFILRSTLRQIGWRTVSEG